MSCCQAVASNQQLTAHQLLESRECMMVLTLFGEAMEFFRRLSVLQYKDACSTSSKLQRSGSIQCFCVCMVVQPSLLLQNGSFLPLVFFACSKNVLLLCPSTAVSAVSMYHGPSLQYTTPVSCIPIHLCIIALHLAIVVSLVPMLTLISVPCVRFCDHLKCDICIWVKSCAATARWGFAMPVAC